MTSVAAQPASFGEGEHLVLYDGVCGLCNRLVQFLLAHDQRAVFTFASLQSPVGRVMVERFGGDPDELSSFYVLASYRSNQAQMFNRARAALFVASTLRWPWKMAVVMRLLPTSILDGIYNVVARNRYRVFGRVAHCLIPRPEFRARFVDSARV